MVVYESINIVEDISQLRFLEHFTLEIWVIFYWMDNIESESLKLAEYEGYIQRVYQRPFIRQECKTLARAKFESGFERPLNTSTLQ